MPASNDSLPTPKTMKIAVVGGGIFGCTTAWFLARDGFQVDLFERNPDLLQSASGINQYRLHRGYHYLRSKETILVSKFQEPNFISTYPEAMMSEGVDHYYCIAREKTLTSPEQAKSIWKECGLEFEETQLNFVNNDKIALSVKVNEKLFDPDKLRDLCRQKLQQYGVNVLLNNEVRPEDVEEYDLVIIATYSGNNTLLEQFPHAQREYQFELCEKVVLKLPEKFSNKSVVIMDGPFMCIDPFGDTGYFVMGNVEHAVHIRTSGKFFDIPAAYKPLLNKGVIGDPPKHLTNIKLFLETAEQFFPGIKEAEYIGSMYTIRTVPPYRNYDDARPTIVEQVSDKFVTVFSGKIGTCVEVGDQILAIAQRRRASLKMSVGIVGIGRWGKNLVRVFNELSTVRMCASRSNPETQAWLHYRHPNIEHTFDYTELLSGPSIDAVVIATPISTHFSVAKQALDAGKHVFLEKPIAMTSKDAEELAGLAEKKGVILFIGHIFLYHPVLTRIKELTKGDPVSTLKLVWRKYGTFYEHIVPNLVSHEVSIALDLFGALPLRARVLKMEGVKSDADIIDVEYDFPAGGKCDVSVNRVHDEARKTVEVITAAGAHYKWEGSLLYCLNPKSGAFDIIYECKEEPLQVECQAFLDAVRSRGMPATNARFGADVVKMLEMLD